MQGLPEVEARPMCWKLSNMEEEVMMMSWIALCMFMLAMATEVPDEGSTGCGERRTATSACSCWILSLRMERL